MPLSFVICTHNRVDLLKDALGSFISADKPRDENIEILVVANACTDQTIAYVTDLAKSEALAPLSLRCIDEPRPGKSYALNRAIDEARSNALCFIDDDQLISPDFITNIVLSLSTYPEYSIICGHLVPDWDGSEPAWVHETGEYRIPIRPFPEFDMGDAPTEVFPEDKLPSGGNITVRLSAFEKCGRFSVDIGPQGHNLMGGEDIDFVRRCLNQGLRIIYSPLLRQRHMILHDRIRTMYMMRKSYLRSFSAGRMDSSNTPGIRGYMLKKLFNFVFHALTSLDSNRRFYFLMRLSAVLGEMHAAVKRQ